MICIASFYGELVNVRIFISFQISMSPGINVSVGFTYITGVAVSTEKLINYIGL